MADPGTQQTFKQVQTESEPHLLDLHSKGYIEGLCITDKRSGTKACYYYGGLPYALPPTGPFRWQRPRPLPPFHSYGTKTHPGRFTGAANVCPQIGRGPPSPLFSEDCLQLNIWVPHGAPPTGGWPVYFFIHGGFLQFGDANGAHPVALFTETACRFVVVKPAYRLGVLGFLASREAAADPANRDASVGNLGLWDVRAALEWTARHVGLFGGDAANITVGGYSAGAHAAFHQLAYDIALPPAQRLVRRAVLQSNGPGPRPKALAEAQLHFDELLHRLGVAQALSPAEKMAALRGTSWQTLLSAVERMNLHQFRSISDGAFVRAGLFADLASGAFAARLAAADASVLVGECGAEWHNYGTWRPPPPGLHNLLRRFEADYARRVVDVVRRAYFPQGTLPPRFRDWGHAFGAVYADLQVHASERGLVDALARHGAAHLVQRYRIEYRVGVADTKTPLEWGATHAADMFLWWFGDGYVLEPEEKKAIREGLLDGFAKFVGGGDPGWGVKAPMECKRLKADGSVDIWRDDWWDEKISVWNELMKVMVDESGLKPRL